MIIRANTNQNYSVINNTVLRDSRLSWRARGIAAYLLTQRDDWEINSVHLWRHGLEGRDAVRNCLSELEEAGYLRRVKYQAPNGQWITELHLSEIPTPENQSSENQSSENQSSENQSPIINTKQVITKQRKTKQVNTKAAAAAFSPSLVREDLDDSNSKCRDHAHDATRIAAARFAADTFPNGGFNGLAGYINDLPPDRLTLFCALCYYANIKADRGDDDIDDFAAFIRGMTQKGHPPSFTPQEQEQFDIRMTAYLHEIESDVWEESQESEVTI